MKTLPYIKNSFLFAYYIIWNVANINRSGTKTCERKSRRNSFYKASESCTLFFLVFNVKFKCSTGVSTKITTPSHFNIIKIVFYEQDLFLSQKEKLSRYKKWLHQKMATFNWLPINNLTLCVSFKSDGWEKQVAQIDFFVLLCRLWLSHK